MLTTMASFQLTNLALGVSILRLLYSFP